MSRGAIVRRGRESWRIKYDAGSDPVTGKRLTHYLTVRGTRRRAQEELTRLLRAIDSGNFVDPNKETIAAFFDRWLSDWAALNTSPTTLQRYRGLTENQIKPELGQLPIQKLRPVHLNELYAKLVRDGLAPRTAGHAHRLLHRALGHAVTWGVIATNPASAVQPPRVEATEVEILKADQVETLLHKLGGRSLYPIAMFGLASGCRRGEMLALRWSDLDLTAGKVRIERSLEQTTAGGLRFKATKTRSGRRTISIAPTAIAVLRAHRKVQQERALALGLGKLRDDALVFATWNGEPRSRTRYRRTGRRPWRGSVSRSR